ncbi:MAG TPA: hypothetical protein VL572_00865 [Pyrinomonadaceae bacterium]|jgi:hypothetical protein|nr:hypothetical protein [Pyrinomonadaceae bacterium]
MESFLSEKKPEKKGINYGFLIGVVVGVLLIGAAIWVMLLRPPVQDQRAMVLEGAFREGSPEFAAVTKDIVISTDDRTVESPTGLGTISMFIVGKVRNKGTKTITILEIEAAVIDQQNNVLKSKNVLVVPEQSEPLGPGEMTAVTLALEGFDRKADRANIRWKVTALRTADQEPSR